MSQNLDLDELFHLAIHATQDGRYDAAITYLKQALELDPENAEVIYLLAAQHAQLGMYDRAVEGMSKALELKPELHTTRFQLGLLYLTLAQPDKAVETLEPLGELPEDEPLRLFKQGLNHLIKDEFAECKANLRQGIELNQVNLVLNDDMQKIIDEVEALEAAQAGATAEAVKASNDGEEKAEATADKETTKEKSEDNASIVPNPVLLSAYKRNDNDSDA